MEAKRLSKVQLDAFTTLPEAILEAILCLLPIEEAARTSILSREWRYKWTKIPEVVFLNDTVKELTREIDWNSDSEVARRDTKTRSKLFHAILQVLCMRQGPIHEFTFWISKYHTFFDIDQIMLHLVRNHHTVKKLTLDFFYAKSDSNGLPLSVFSLHHLTDLDLAFCEINYEPIFCKFGSLTSLSLNYVMISRETLLQLLSNCPSLRSLYLMLDEQVANHERPNIAELFKCLPVIEELTIQDDTFELFALDSVQQELPTSLIHLKYFCFEDIAHNSICNNYGFTFLVVLAKCSPNLEKIKLKMEPFTDGFLEEYSFKLEEYSGIRLENLKELEIVNFKKFMPELEFVKFILAKSPNMKKVILLTCEVNKNEELEMLKDLSHAPHSSLVQIIVKNQRKD